MEDDRYDPRLLLVLQDLKVSWTRADIYGYILYKFHKDSLQKLEFYHDWTPDAFGPKSPAFDSSLAKAVEDGFVSTIAGNSDEMPVRYELSKEPAADFKRLVKRNKAIYGVNRILHKLERISTMEMLRDIYDNNSPETSIYKYINHPRSMEERQYLLNAGNPVPATR